jgi:hypothetical protein
MLKLSLAFNLLECQKWSVKKKSDVGRKTDITYIYNLLWNKCWAKILALGYLSKKRKRMRVGDILLDSNLNNASHLKLSRQMVANFMYKLYNTSIEVCNLFNIIVPG